MDGGIHHKKTKTQDSVRTHEQQEEETSLANTLEHIMGQLDVLTQVWFAFLLLTKVLVTGRIGNVLQ